MDRAPVTTEASGTPVSDARRCLIERLAQRAVERPVTAPTSLGGGGAPVDLQGNTIAGFYDAVSRSLDATAAGRWALFLNLGYLDGADDRSRVRLPRNTLDRPSVKLILELVGDCLIDGRRVLDVGSGRGGTISTLLQYFNPALTVGLELSPAAAAFCRRTIRDGRVSFYVGDAQGLPFATGAFDIVINVESSHCYPDLSGFYAQVRRVLGPGGTFLYSDLLETASLDRQRGALDRLGFRFELERDITANVLASCDLIAERRKHSFASEDDHTLQRFLTVPGSPTYESMLSRRTMFFIWRLRTPR